MGIGRGRSPGCGTWHVRTLSLDPPRDRPDKLTIRGKGAPIRENGSSPKTQSLDQKGTFSMPSSHSPSRLSVMFDDDHAVADAGLALVCGAERDARSRSARRGAGRRSSLPGTSGRDARARDGRRRQMHRRRRRAALRVDRGGARPQGDGALDARDLPPVLSPSDTSASSTRCPRRCSPGRGLLALGPETSR